MPSRIAHAPDPILERQKPLTNLQHTPRRPSHVAWFLIEGHSSSAFVQADGLAVGLDVGETLVWRGDLAHAGAGYAEEHYRVHAYLDAPFEVAGYERAKESTNKCAPTPTPQQQQPAEPPAPKLDVGSLGTSHTTTSAHLSSQAGQPSGGVEPERPSSGFGAGGANPFDSSRSF